MNNYSLGKRVLIMKNPGKGGIEQAIFILSDGETEEDYIISEAKKIIDDFAKRNGFKPRGIKPFYAVAVITVIAAVAFAVLMR